MKRINWDRAGKDLKNAYDTRVGEHGFEEMFHQHVMSQSPDLYDDIPDTKEPETKKQKVEIQETVSQSTGEEILDEAMNLPGTAQGQGGQGDGNSNSSMVMYTAPSPKSIFGRKDSTYTKVHRFVTYGLAHAWLSNNLSGPTETQRWLTTALAEIPWQFPFLYLNPSEYANIANGSYVDSVNVTIIHRGVRMAFETSSDTTQLATLNQIQNLQVAYGLNKTGWGTERSYDIVSTNPMVPQAQLDPVYANYPLEMYGSPFQTSIESVVPNHQVGQKMPIRNYWTFVTTEEQFGGVPCLQEAIQMSDAKTSVNQTIGSWSYKPVKGMLKTPLKHLRTGLPSGIGENINIPMNCVRSESNAVHINQTSLDQSGGITSIGDTLNNPNNSFDSTIFTYNSPIEKSQFLKQGPWGQDKAVEVQPSIHVGVQAIPAITATSGFGVFTKFTDTQSDFEVICTMKVIEYLPTAFPHTTSPNVPAGKVIYQTNEPPSQLACTYGGLLPSKAIRRV